MLLISGGMFIIFQPLYDCSNKNFKSGQPSYPFNLKKNIGYSEQVQVLIIVLLIFPTKNSIIFSRRSMCYCAFTQSTLQKDCINYEISKLLF